MNPTRILLIGVLVGITYVLMFWFPPKPGRKKVLYSGAYMTSKVNEYKSPVLQQGIDNPIYIQGWVNSTKAVAVNTDVFDYHWVIFVDFEPRRIRLKFPHVKFVQAKTHTKIWRKASLPVWRFYLLKDFLEINRFDWIVFNDIRDIVFGRDVFPLFEQHSFQLWPEILFMKSKEHAVQEYGWLEVHNFLQCYPNTSSIDYPNYLKRQHPIYFGCGVLAGNYLKILDVLSMMTKEFDAIPEENGQGMLCDVHLLANAYHNLLQSEDKLYDDTNARYGFLNYGTDTNIRSSLMSLGGYNFTSPYFQFVYKDDPNSYYIYHK